MPSTESNDILTMLLTAPSHILLQITKYLPPEEFSRLMFVSQHFKHLLHDTLKDEHHWKKLAEKYFPANSNHRRSQLSNIAHLSRFHQYVRLHQKHYEDLTSRDIQLFSAVKSRDLIYLQNLQLTFDELALKESFGNSLYNTLAHIGHQPTMDYVFSNIIMPYYQHEPVYRTKNDNERGFTVLNHAAALNQVPAIHEYIQLPNYTFNIDDRRINQRSIELAARFGHSASVEALITHFNADSINTPDSYNTILESALSEAAKHGRHATVKILSMHGVNINGTSTLDFSPIHHAAASGSLKTVKACLDAGANPSLPFTQPFNHTTLHAAIVGGNVDILEAMLASKDIKDQLTDDLKVALLHYSAYNGNFHAFERFLQLALDANLDPIQLIHFEDEHLLNQAVKNMNVGIIKTILAFAKQHEMTHIIAGAGKDNKTPLHHAATAKESNPEHNEIFDRLLEITPDIDMPSDQFYETPLDMAAMNSNDAYALEALLKKGANPNGNEQSRITPLYRAIDFDPKHALKKTACLIEHKANIDLHSKKENGFSPLHLAATLDRTDIMVMLLDHHADINTIDNDGNTPLHLAMKESNDCAELLLERGADFKAVNLENNRPLKIYLKNLPDLNYDLIDRFLAKGDSITWVDTPPTSELSFVNTNISQRVFFALLKATKDANELILDNLEIKADQTPLDESTLPEHRLPKLKVITINSRTVHTPDTRKILKLIIQASPNLLRINSTSKRDLPFQEMRYHLLCELDNNQKYPQATRMLASIYESGIRRDDNTYIVSQNLFLATALYSLAGDAQDLARVQDKLKQARKPGLFALPQTDKPDNKRTSDERGNSPKRRRPC